MNQYDQHAEEFVRRYESLPFEQVHADLLEHLPVAGANILDVGSGSGRDAAWFAARGDMVVAAEPSDGMRARAIALHASPNIQWLRDSLPDLVNVRRLGLSFDLILLSAVWMHVSPSERLRTLRKLSTLLTPTGRIAITLRLGAPDSARAMHAVSTDELGTLARQFGLRVVACSHSGDQLGRGELSWATMILGLPADGLGTLPLLRHLILRDDKSSTYKIGLLRILARIADTAGGIVRHESDAVAVPLGLVALYWLRMYKPLVENGVPQKPASAKGSGLGFVDADFHATRSVSAIEMRIGAIFSAPLAGNVHRCLWRIGALIRDMPARYIKWPSTEKSIFAVLQKRRQTMNTSLTIDEAYLWSMGEFRIPAEIWHAFCHFNVWIEPVLVSEWGRLISGYAGADGKIMKERADELLVWGDPMRDVETARAAVERLRSAGKPVYCVWSGNRLNNNFEVDHCFPFSAWPCDDLWNLMPTGSVVNRKKSDHLITVEMLDRSSERVIDWWSQAYLDPALSTTDRFFSEARQTLPIFSDHQDVSAILEAMRLHRMRLYQDQGLRSWEM